MWCVKQILFLVILSIFGQSRAQLLWKVSAPEQDQVVYLMGTIHLPMGDFVEDHDTLKSIISQCDCLYTETSLDQNHVASVIDQYITLPEGIRLSDSLSAQEWLVLDSNLKLAGGMFSADMFNGFKPMYVSVIVSMLPMLSKGAGAGKDGISVDESIVNFAKHEGLEMKYLETQEQQLQFIFNDIPLANQFRMLRSSLKHNPKTDSLSSQALMLPELYQRQSLDSIGLLIKTTAAGGMDELEFYEGLIYKRNRTWMDTITRLMHDSGHKYFMAVGAGHLPGENGLLELLRKEGYRVEAVIFD
jgi:uncharacterized protein